MSVEFVELVEWVSITPCVLYEQLLKSEEQVYGNKSVEVRDAASDYANFLIKIKYVAEASRIQTTYHLNNTGK